MISDTDGNERGWDWIQVPNYQGSFDIGYDENTDIIFKTGFE